MLFAVMIDGVQAKTAALHEHDLIADVSFLKEELFLPDILWHEELYAMIKFLVGEVNTLLEVGS